MQRWHGIGSPWCRFPFIQQPEISIVIDGWKNDIDLHMKKWALNTIRLGFSFFGSGGTTCQVITYEIEDVISLFHAHSIKVILSLINWRDMPGYFGSPEWIQAWIDLATKYKNDSRILAYELFNEPYGPDKPDRIVNWHSSVTGGGSTIPYEGVGKSVRMALAECLDAIRATGDMHPIIYPDPWYFNVGAEIYDASNFASSPEHRDNIIIATHEWHGNPNAQSVEGVMEHLGRAKRILETWGTYYSVWLGEFGRYTEFPWEIQKLWCVELINYVTSLRGGGFCYWLGRSSESLREEEWTAIDEMLTASNYRVPSQLALPFLLTAGLVVLLSRG